MKKYPYIGQLGNRILFTSKGTGALIGAADGSEPTGFTVSVSNECDYKDITREYLQNTWGVVESKEHAEYIAELAGSAGLITSDTWNDTYHYFSVNYNGLLFWCGKDPAESRGFKQIKIPLPPKEKGWPKVDDEIEWGSGNIGIIKSLSDEFAWVKRSDNHQYTTIYASSLKKPKSKQDLLIEELHQKLLANNCSDEYLLACDIVQGKIEGLSYNP